MVNNDERREVARRLRGIKDTREGCGHDMCCDLWSAVFDSDYRCTDLCDECEVAVLNSLADLIEPDTTSDTTKTASDTTKCDREALLALADEMSDWTWYETEGDHRIAEGFARRIREACGAIADAQ